MTEQEQFEMNREESEKTLESFIDQHVKDMDSLGEEKAWIKSTSVLQGMSETHHNNADMLAMVLTSALERIVRLQSHSTN